MNVRIRVIVRTGLETVFRDVLWRVQYFTRLAEKNVRIRSGRLVERRTSDRDPGRGHGGYGAVRVRP